VIRRLFLFVIVLVLAAGVGGYLWLRSVSEPYKGYASQEVFVEIPSGTGVNAIGRRLVEAGVVQSTYAFQAAMRLHANGQTLKAGEYRFSGPMTPDEVIDKLARGDVYLKPITFPEGLTIAEMGRVFETQGFGKAAAFVKAAQDSSPVEKLDPQAPDLEGYLFPETYTLARSAKAEDLITQMTARFAEVYTPELRKAAEARGMSTREVLTMASLIEKETARSEERFLVSAVYHNRLKIGMGMQCDPTVIYALQKAGRYNGNLTRADLQFDSPYNTYRYAGLPPGPIAAPGRLAIEAAVKPAEVPYLYFVSKNDGSHVFAATLAEHNRNVQEYQVRYFRNLRLQKRSSARPTSISGATRRSTTAS
jgi:UPF0755 protein